jgi:hypothetical protein
VTHVSVSNDIVNNAGIIAPYVVASASHGNGGDGSITVLVKLLRPIPIIRSRARNHYAVIFRLDEVQGLGLVDDSLCYYDSVLGFW